MFFFSVCAWQTGVDTCQSDHTIAKLTHTHATHTQTQRIHWTTTTTEQQQQLVLVVFVLRWSFSATKLAVVSLWWDHVSHEHPTTSHEHTHTQYQTFLITAIMKTSQQSAKTVQKKMSVLGKNPGVLSAQVSWAPPSGQEGSQDFNLHRCQNKNASTPSHSFVCHSTLVSSHWLISD